MFQKRYPYKPQPYTNIHELSDPAKRVLRELVAEIEARAKERLSVIDIVELAEEFQVKSARIGYNFTIEASAIAFVDKSVFELFEEQMGKLFWPQ